MQKRLLVTSATQNSKSHVSKDNSDKDAVQDDKQGKEGRSEVVDLRDLSRSQRQQIVDNALATNEQSNKVLLQQYADRADNSAHNQASENENSEKVCTSVQYCLN